MKISFDEMKKRANLIYNNYYTYDEQSYTKLVDNMNIICPVHGSISVSAKKHLHRGLECKDCKKEKLRISLEKQYKIKVETLGFKSAKLYYKDSHTKITITCTEHGDFYKLPEECEVGCPTCNLIQRGIERAIPKDEFIKRSKLVHGDLYNYDNIEYTNISSKVHGIFCPEHKSTFSTLCSNHLSGYKCNICYEPKVKTTERFINEARLVHDNTYYYNLVDYINNETKVQILCSEHGDFWQIPISHINHKSGCPSCAESTGERDIRNLLENHNIKFISQYREHECKRTNTLVFDFYLPDYNVCIEYDGIQHFKSIEYFGGDNRLQYVQENDIIKNEYCLTNNIRMFRIKYDDDLNVKFYELMRNLKCPNY